MKISIITPSFNQGIFIERTIKSVLTQNIPDLEYIVLDNQSQDETLAILHRYAERLHYISEQDRGQAHAVNKGLSLATGDIIGWLNSDDIYYPDTLSKVLNYFAKHENIDVVYGDAYHINENDEIISPYPTEHWNFDRLKKTCFLSQPAVFFRRHIVSQIGFLDESLHFCMDYEYWLRLAMMGASFGYLPEVLAGSRLYPGTKTCSAPIKATFEALAMLKNRIGYVPTDWLVNYAVLLVKERTQQSRLNMQSVFNAWKIAAIHGFKWNGFFQGLQTLVNLPITMIRVRLDNKK